MDKALKHVLDEVKALPDEEQRRIARVVEAEVRQARRNEAAAGGGRWARLAERLSADSPLEGRSDELLRRVRDAREGFAMMEPTTAE